MILYKICLNVLSIRIFFVGGCCTAGAALLALHDGTMTTYCAGADCWLRTSLGISTDIGCLGSCETNIVTI